MSETGKRRDLQAVVPSTRARSLLWHVFSLDTAYLEVADHHEPFEKPGAHVFWVLSGHGTLETDGNKYLLQPGNSVWFVDMTKARTYAPAAGQLLVKRGMRLGGPALENWHKELGGSKRAKFDLEGAAPLHRDFRDLRRICDRKAPGWEWQVHLILTGMLGTLLNSRDALSLNATDLPASVMRVLNAVDAKPHYDWRVKELAAVAGVSYSGLRTLFYEVMGENLHNYVQRRRMEHAQLLLSDPGLSVKQVATQPVILCHFPAHVQSVENVGHHNVKQDEIRLLPAHYLQRLIPVASGEHLIIVGFQDNTGDFSEIAIVVDYKNPLHSICSLGMALAFISAGILP